jgi:invasion protein IalB
VKTCSGWLWRMAQAVAVVTTFHVDMAAQASDEDARLAETFGNWTVGCQQQPVQASRASDATGPSCQMSQELRNADNGQRVLAMALPAVAAPSGANALIVAPFGLKLDAGIAIEVDGDALVVVPFQTCLPVGCLAQLSLDETQLERLGRGRTATVTMTVVDGGEPLRLDISLDGFAEAYERLTAPEQATE